MLGRDDFEAACCRHAFDLSTRSTPETLRTVSLDGRTLRGSSDRLVDRRAVHVLSAFASDAAQVRPGLADHAAGNLVYRSQVETARLAPATDGALFAPARAGMGVEGGARARMEREDTAREAR